MHHPRAVLIALCALSYAAPARAAETPTISIGLFAGRRLTACTVSSQSAIAVTSGDDIVPVEAPAGAKLTLTLVEDGVRLVREGGAPAVEAASFSLSSAELLRVRVEGSAVRTYRGALEVHASSAKLLLVNRVSREDYLRGVVPAEMPASFALEALKAQVIAARTYALADSGKHRSEGYDLCDGSHCQVYEGAGREKPRVEEAVQETAGLIVTYQGRPISAVYHNTCGGETAACEEAWITRTQTPYLRGVDDTYDGVALCAASPKAQWRRTVSQEKLCAALARYGVTAPLTMVRPEGCADGTRPDGYQFIGTEGTWTVPAGAVRTAITRSLGTDSLPSANFVADIAEDTITLTGWGSGHGVGLCQWGANGMAKLGKSAAEILAHYYVGTKVEVAP